MGLFDFVKDAGSELFGGGVENKEASASVTVSPERVNELRKENIVRMLEEADLQVTDLSVTVDGELATIAGQVATQEECEKVTLTAGNQYGIAKVDCQIEVEEAGAAEAQMYTVKSGDSLSKIAKEFYGDANKYPVIFEANKPMLSDPNKIYPGQALRIPALS